MSTNNPQRKDATSTSNKNNKKRRAANEPMAGSEEEAKDAKKLAGTKDFILHCIRAKLIVKEFCWDKLPMEWKTDQEVAAAALKHDKITYDDLPTDLKTNQPFLVSAVIENSKVWMTLPDQLRNDIDFARSLTAFTDFYVFKKMLGTFPGLQNERGLWLALIRFPEPDAFDIDHFWHIFNDYAPPNIRADPSIMLTACAICHRLLVTCVDNSLSQSHDFLTGVLRSAPEALLVVPQASLAMFPVLIQKFLSNALHSFGRRLKAVNMRNRCTALAKNLPNEFWASRENLKIWFQSGGPFIESIAGLRTLSRDEEVFLWIAKYCPKDDGVGLWSSFGHASQHLRHKKAFMLTAILLNPNAYHAAMPTLQNDFDVWLAAFGGTPGMHPSIDSVDTWIVLRESIAEFGVRVQEELQRMDVFLNTFLAGMSHPKSSGGAVPSSLLLLNQGETTSVNYKSLIAAYLDVPTGKRLQMLRNSLVNLGSVCISVAANPNLYEESTHSYAEVQV